MLFIPALLLSVYSFSQAYTYSSLSELMTSNLIRVVNLKSETGEYSGSPYENEMFTKGELITKSRVIYKDVPLRINLYNNSIEYESDGKAYELSNLDYFDYFTIGQSKFKFLPYRDGKRIDKSFLKVEEEGKATLLVRPVVKFEEATKPGAYQDAKPASFTRLTDQIYIKIGESEAHQVTGKKSIEEIFADKKETINKYLSENKIKFNNTEDLVKLVKFYNAD